MSDKDEVTGRDAAWSTGLERALSTISQAIENGNGPLLQIGFDRLQTRSEWSQALAEAMPYLGAEAVQEGMAKAWRKASANAEHQEPGKLPYFPTLCEDNAWLLGIVSEQDEWSRICVSEAVRLMASSSARAAPLVKAIKGLTLDDCVASASSFFGALLAYDRIARIAEPSREVGVAVGQMLLAYGADAKGPGIWTRCQELSSFWLDPGNTIHMGRSPQMDWPMAAKVAPATFLRTIGLANQGDTPGLKEVAKEHGEYSGRARRTPRG